MHPEQLIVFQSQASMMDFKENIGSFVIYCNVNDIKYVRIIISPYEDNSLRKVIGFFT